MKEAAKIIKHNKTEECSARLKKGVAMWPMNSVASFLAELCNGHIPQGLIKDFRQKFSTEISFLSFIDTSDEKVACLLS
jgi:hypothetical protein